MPRSCGFFMPTVSWTPGVCSSTQGPRRDLLGQMLAAMSGRYEANEPDGAWLRTIDSAIGAHLPLLVARSQVWLGQLEEAQEVLAEHYATREVAEASQPGMLAMIACLQGRLRDAYRLGIAALQQAETPGVPGLATLDARVGAG